MGCADFVKHQRDPRSASRTRNRNANIMTTASNAVFSLFFQFSITGIFFYLPQRIKFSITNEAFSLHISLHGKGFILNASSWSTMSHD